MRDKNDIRLKVLELAGWGTQALRSLDEAVEGSIPVSSDRAKDAEGSNVVKTDREDVTHEKMGSVRMRRPLIWTYDVDWPI